MSMKTSSILNDVLGPVMSGPSSSHTAAPGKIGLTVSKLWGGKVTAADVVYDERGSYPSTHVGQGSDFGFAAGLQGMPTDHPCFRDSIKTARENGVRIRFLFAELGAHHPNEARIDIYEEDGERVALSVLSFSTGGGTFLIPEIDGFRIHYDGQRKKCYICCIDEAVPKIDALLFSLHCVYTKEKIDPMRTTFTGLLPEEAVLFEVEAASLAAQQLPESLENISGILYIREIESVVPVPLRLEPAVPFACAEEMLAYCDTNGIDSMPELALLYECSLGAIGLEDIDQCMRHVLCVMRRSMMPPPADDPVKMLIAPMISERLMRLNKLPVDMGVLECCMKSAVAVMENSCIHRAIVAAPTAGSSGILPATIVALGERLCYSDMQIINALWTAGLVGAFIANQATFGGEVAGCQAEVGAAACMAAAGVVQLLGGNIRQCLDAASIAMHSFLGLICDPIGGITEVPCIERNVTATAVVVMASNMAMCGMTSHIPLDETICTMLSVGKMLPDELCCTCRGGLCATKTGKELAAEVAKSLLQRL